MTMIVTLRTAAENPADRKFVAEFTIPLFNPAPRVLGWENRVFAFEDDNEHQLHGPKGLVHGYYAEVFAYAIVHRMPAGADPTPEPEDETRLVLRGAPQ